MTSQVLQGGQDLKVFVLDKHTLESLFKKYGVSAVCKKVITSYQCNTYLFDLEDSRDVLKLDKVVKFIEIDLRQYVILDKNTLNNAFTVSLFRNEVYFDIKHALRDTARFFRTSTPHKCMSVLGADVLRNPVILDYDKISHVLIAGATGSGKSVLLHTLICSLLFAHNKNINLTLVDLKCVELSKYSNILNINVVTDLNKAIMTLEYYCDYMNNRYLKMKERNIRAWDGTQEFIIIDELADLMLSSRYEVEEYLIKLAQKARACGIHLILATQRPSVNVITGLIKANISTRIALQTASIRDSICILDHSGAEKLHGKGDAIIKLPYSTKEVRFQVAYTSDENIEITTREYRAMWDKKINDLFKVDREVYDKIILKK